MPLTCVSASATLGPAWFRRPVQTTDGTVKSSEHTAFLGVAARRHIDVDEPTRRRLVAELGRASQPAQVIFETPAHFALTTQLVLHTSMLSRGAFIGTNGMHARTIVGPKGVGKTTVLRQFVHVCEAAFPNVVPVYVTCGNDFATSPLSEQSILPLVATVLKKRDMISGETIASARLDMYNAIVDALEAADKYVLLVVDELEELYRVKPVDARPSLSALRSLHNLSSIGNRELRIRSVLRPAVRIQCGASAAGHVPRHGVDIDPLRRIPANGRRPQPQRHKVQSVALAV